MQEALRIWGSQNLPVDGCRQHGKYGALDLQKVLQEKEFQAIVNDPEFKRICRQDPMKLLLILLLLTGCFNTLRLQDVVVSQSLSPRKQKQKIVSLQKRLDLAEREQRVAQAEVDKLALEIEEAQVALIRREVDDYERKKRRTSDLFLEEREALYHIIRSGPGPASFQAQAELDRILRLITERSDRPITH